MTETTLSHEKVYETRHEEGHFRVYRYSLEDRKAHKVEDFVFGFEAKQFCREENAKLPNGGLLPKPTENDLEEEPSP